MAHGFLFLIAVLDISSRKVLAFRLPNTLTPDLGEGRWVDNVLIERLWRSVKFENVYLYAYRE
jgi:hypothetical protein